MSGIDEAFADGPAFVPYLAVGDPDYESSKAYVEALARGGADVIELGLPFSEPVAEGPTIQGAVTRALEAGMTPEKYFEFVEDLDVDVPLVCMTYYNLIYQFETGDDAREGPRPFVERAAEAGIEGFVVPDLPAEEAGPLRDACDDLGLDLVFIVAPTTEGERLERIMDQVSGYVYVQARLGVTGARDDVSSQTDEALGRLDDWDVSEPRSEARRTPSHRGTNAGGLGINTRDHPEPKGAGGAARNNCGCALVDIVADGYQAGRPVDDVAADLEAKARELKEGARSGYEQRVPEPEHT
jgi:tryptophan synthase alpha chain